MDRRDGLVCLLSHPNGGWAVHTGDWGAEGVYETREGLIEALPAILDRAAEKAASRRARDEIFEKQAAVGSLHGSGYLNCAGDTDFDFPTEQ